MRRVIAGAWLALLLLAPNMASAHVVKLGVATSTLDARANQLVLQVQAPPEFEPVGADEAARTEYVAKYVGQRLLVSQMGVPCVFVLQRFVPATRTSFLLIQGVFTCSAVTHGLSNLAIRSVLFADYPDYANNFMVVRLDGEPWSLVFSRGHDDFPQTVTAQPYVTPSVAAPIPGFWAVAGQFLWTGVLHIWTGLDHILFLVATILLVRRPKRILLLVTMFTVAHTITLLLAGFGIVALAPRIVEPLIAVSILYMAGRDIWILRRKKQPMDVASERLLVVGAFGLIHGLGFAGSLLEVPVPQAYFVPALLSFNVGVELGQLAILAVLVPLLLLVDRLAWRRQVLLFVAVGAAGLAAIWLVQRLAM